MQTVSDGFKEQSVANDALPYVRVTIGDNVLDSSSLQSVRVSIDATSSESFDVGTTASASCTIVALNDALPLVYTASNIKVEFGYEVNGEVEYIPIGIFATNDSLVSSTSLFTTITGYDAFYWLDASFSGSFSTSTLTTRQMMKTVVSGTSINYTDTELPNVSLAKYRPKGTVRECIGQICAASFVNARFDGYGNLRFSMPTETGITFDMLASGTVVSELTVSSDYAENVDHVTTTFTKSYQPDANYNQKDDEEIVTTYPASHNGVGIEYDSTLFGGGQFTYVSSSNDGGLAAAQADLSRIQASATSNKLIPRAYKGFDMTLLGYPQLEPYDTFKVVDVNGKEHTLTAFSITWEYDGNLKTILSAVASSETTGMGTSSASVANIASTVSTLAGKYVTLNNLTVETLKGDNASFNTVMADKISTDELTVDNLSSNTAFIEKIVSNQTTTDSLVANEAFVDKLTANEAFVVAIVANQAFIKKLSADEAFVDSLKVNVIDAVTGDFDTLLADSASFKEVLAKIGDFESLETDYIQIGFANITQADIEAFYAKQGMIDNVHIGEATVSGSLVSVTFTGDVIEAGTLKADRLYLLGDDGLYYALNVTALGESYVSELPKEQQEELKNGIHGQTIIAESITADKISVTDLSALNATIGGFKIDDKAVHTPSKTAYDTGIGTWLGSDGQFGVGSANEYVRYNPETEKLEISTSDITLNTTSLIVALENAAKSATDFLTYEDGTLTISSSHDNPNISLKLTNSVVGFTTTDSATPVTYFGKVNDNWQMSTSIVEVTEQLWFNKLCFITRSNGNLSIKRVTREVTDLDLSAPVIKPF